MFITQIIIGTLITVTTVIFHVGGLVLLADTLTKLSNIEATGQKISQRMLILVVTVLFILAIHTAEAWFWAGVLLLLGEFSQLGEALYFSVVTSTTLGYGDLTLSSTWRLLGTFEAMGGLILFGASTAFLFEVMRQLFEKKGT